MGHLYQGVNANLIAVDTHGNCLTGEIESVEKQAGAWLYVMIGAVRTDLGMLLGLLTRLLGRF